MANPAMSAKLMNALKELEDKRGQLTRRSTKQLLNDGERNEDEEEEHPELLSPIEEKHDPEGEPHDEDWIEDEPWGSRGYFRPTDRVILNDADPNLPPVPIIMDPIKLITECLELIVSLYKAFSDIEEDSFLFTDQKKFLEIVKQTAFKRFSSLTAQLSNVQLGKLQLDERLCFFVNARTCLGLHSFAEFGIPHSVFKRLSNLHQKIVYNIGGNLYSFSDITFGVLKASMSLPDVFGFSFILPLSKFDPTDPRYPYRNPEKLPLLNFTLFEGTSSQPV